MIGLVGTIWDGEEMIEKVMSRSKELRGDW
jgi:hypothetical protein